MTWTDIQNRVYFLTGTTSSSFSAANLTLAVGRGYERVATLISKNYYGWDYDDSNYTDLPTATFALVSGQMDYTLAATFRTVDRVERKDAAGNWARLSQIDQQMLKRDRDASLAYGETTRSGAYQATNGTPTEYDLLGTHIFLLPVPNYSLTKALRIFFNRAPLLFDYTTGKFTDGTGSASNSPGFDSLFHDLIALWASFDYCLKAGKQNTNQIFAEIQRKEQELVDAYGHRDRDLRPRFTMSLDSNK